MPTIRARLENLNSNELQAELKKVKAKVGIFGGRYYTLKDHKGSLSLKKIIQISENTSHKDGHVYAINLSNRLTGLNTKGEDELSRVNCLRKFFTRIKRAFGNRGFDKVEAIENLKNLAPRVAPRPLGPKNSSPAPHSSSSSSSGSQQFAPAPHLTPSAPQSFAQPTPSTTNYNPIEGKEVIYAYNLLMNRTSENAVQGYLRSFGYSEERIEQILAEAKALKLEKQKESTKKGSSLTSTISSSSSSSNPSAAPKGFGDHELSDKQIEHNRRIQAIIDNLDAIDGIMSEESVIRQLKSDAGYTDEEIEEARTKRSQVTQSAPSSSSSTSIYGGYPPSATSKSDSTVSSASQRRAKHPLEAEYKPKSATFVDGHLINQFTVGHPSGCTHFAAAFCDLPVNKFCSEKDIENILNRKDLGIIPGENGFADEVLVLPVFKNIELLPGDLFGYAFAFQDYRALEEKLQQLIDDVEVDAFVITTATESLGVRLLNNKDVELFDSHGAPHRRDCPAVVWTFSKEDAAQKIANLIESRVGDGFIGQLSLFPIQQRS